MIVNTNFKIEGELVNQVAVDKAMAWIANAQFFRYWEVVNVLKRNGCAEHHAYLTADRLLQRLSRAKQIETHCRDGRSVVWKHIRAD